MRTIVMNSSNHVEGTKNKFVYTFPSQLKLTENHRIGVSGVSMYNSTFNIEAKRGNNTLTLIWNASSQTSYTFTFPDGYYSVNTLKACLKQWLRSDPLPGMDRGTDGRRDGRTDGQANYFELVRTGSN